MATEARGSATNHGPRNRFTKVQVFARNNWVVAVLDIETTTVPIHQVAKVSGPFPIASAACEANPFGGAGNVLDILWLNRKSGVRKGSATFLL